jgi:hypothetical protein
MPKEAMMPIAADPKKMWTLSADRKTARLALPPLPLAGMREPFRVVMDFDAGTIDATLEWLTVLRSQMLPPIVKN